MVSLLCACGCGDALDFSQGKKIKRYIHGHFARVQQRVRVPLVDRFWPKVDMSGGPDACWPWSSAFHGNGYGAIGRGGMGGKQEPAHRIAWELTFGPIPDGMFVCHHCDNRPCCNPAHLFVGTQQDNIRDMHAKGRGTHKGAYGDRNISRKHPEKFQGERNGRAKLTEDEVRDIRLRYALGGITQQRLADEYGVSQGMVGFIVRRVSWPLV